MHIYQYLFSSIKPSISLESEVEESTSSLKVYEMILKEIEKIKDTRNSLLEVPVESYFDIYDNLDVRSQACFRRVQRNWNQFASSAPVICKIEKLIQENYVDVEGKPILDFKKFYTSRAFRVIGYGDIHTRSVDYFVNAMVTNLAHIPNMIYLDESGPTALDIERKKRRHLFKYFQPWIADTVKSWDLDILKDEEGSGILLKALDFAVANILATQELFKLYHDKKWNFHKFSRLLKINFDKKLCKKLWKSLAVMQRMSIRVVKQDFKKKNLRSPYHLKFNKLILTYSTFILLIKNLERPKYEAQCDEIHRKRDRRLRDCISASLSYNTTVVFAGRAHIYMLSEFYKYFTHFKKLWLIPRDGISEQSVMESYHRIFFPSIGLPFRSSIDRPSISEEPLVATHKAFDHSLSEEDQIRTFLALDVKKLDCFENHFAFWTYFMKKVIMLKMERMSSDVFKAMISHHLWEHSLRRKQIEIIKGYLD